jgi:hypothetical protein
MAKTKKITRTILKGLLITGGVAIAATSPQFLYRILPAITKLTAAEIRKRKKIKEYKRSFDYLKKQSMIYFENRNSQIYISLTPKGKKQAGKYGIDDLKIKKSKKWDGKWRILIFDIREKHKIKREALRGKIKQLGMYKLQDSVWVYPYDFQKEIDILRTFFRINSNEMKIITASDIEDDFSAKIFFGL